MTGNIIITADDCSDNIDASPGEYVRLTVIDNGKGMDAAILEHIFEPFFTTKGVGEGTGLGLATVYGIVTQNSGFISVDSAPAQGSRFMVHLPRFTETAPPEAATVKLPLTGTGTILLVEDDAAILEMLASMLAMLGYKILSAGSPIEAIHICENFDNCLDMIITDVVMQDMNGKEMMATIEAIRPGIKVLYMSGYSAEIMAEKGLLMAEMNFLPKPFDIHELQQKIRETMAKISLNNKENLY